MMPKNTQNPRRMTMREAIYIISGEGMALIGDQEIPLKPGTAIYVAPKTPHAIKRTSKEPLKAVYCHSGFGEGKK
jgi:mannose-6-phosphate isomerase-like protein (cupin superfamily)